MSQIVYNGNLLEYCPQRIQWKYLLKNKDEPSAAMLKGSYFHWLLSGKHADPMKPVEDIQRLKNGNKSSDQLRIESQAEFAKKLLEYRKAKLCDDTTEREIQTPWEEDDRIIIQGHLDYLGPVEKNADIILSIIDFKLCGNINSDFGKWCWGDPSAIDPIQLVTYKYIFNQQTGKDILAGWWVFDYKKEPDYKIIWHHTQPDDLAQFKQTVRIIIDEFNNMEKNDYTERPSAEECRTCSKVCSKRI